MLELALALMLVWCRCLCWPRWCSGWLAALELEPPRAPRVWLGSRESVARSTA